jgi:integrase
LFKFFKWRAYPKLTPQERSRLPRDKYPEVLQGVVLQTKKGSKTPIKQKDIWDDKDTAIFLKYCTDNPRHRFYHALAYQTSARPHELLQLKIADIEIQTDENGKFCALIDVGRYGKKNQSRIVGIEEFAIQYLQPYLSSQHPDPTNRKAYLFVNVGHGAALRNIRLSSDGLRQDYKAFRDRKIPKLLKRPDIPEEDKKHLQFMKETKKWFPYIVRHSSLSKLAPNVSEYRLREHAGWSKRSDMVEVYTHTLTGDSAEDILMLYGVNLKGGKKKRNEHLQQEIVGPHCPFCHTVNIPGTQFCSSCHKPLTSVSMDAIMKEAEERKKELEQMRQDQQKIMNNLKLIIPMLQKVTKNLRAENAVLREANAEMDKHLTEEEREQIEKELQEENEQAARDGIDMDELLRRELLSWTKKI